MFWYFARKQYFYDPDKCEKIISKYSGDRHMQILRALAAMELMPSDIKNYYNSGKSGVPCDEEYRLINRLDREIYKVKRLESGSSFSMLRQNELWISDGKGQIIEHWECA